MPEAVEAAQQEFDDRMAGMLEGMADRIDGEAPGAREDLEDSFERLEADGPDLLFGRTAHGGTADVSCFVAEYCERDGVAGVGRVEVEHASALPTGNAEPPRLQRSTAT